jgi:hypothetical protein
MIKKTIIILGCSFAGAAALLVFLAAAPNAFAGYTSSNITGGTHYQFGLTLSCNWGPGQGGGPNANVCSNSITDSEPNLSGYLPSQIFRTAVTGTYSNAGNCMGWGAPSSNPFSTSGALYGVPFSYSGAYMKVASPGTSYYTPAFSGAINGAWSGSVSSENAGFACYSGAGAVTGGYNLTVCNSGYVATGDGVCTASGCTMGSFSCSNSGQLSWSTSGCSSQTIDHGIGPVGAIGLVAGTLGTTYYLTLNGQQSPAYPAVCPAPILTATWASGGTTMTVNATPGQNITEPFNFSNTGQSGSIIYFSRCRSSGSLSESTIYTCTSTPALVAP